MIDTSLEIIENRNWIAKEGKTISDPLQYGISELMLSFSNNLADKIGCEKICFAHSTKEVKLDRKDKKGRWVEYKETSIRPLPTSYLNTDEYSITLYESGGIIELFILDVFDTGKGLGTKIMNELLDVADEMNVKVKLIPIAYRVSGTKYFERDCARLKKFYMDLGFTPSSISPYLTYFPVADLFGKV